ncbi:TPA: hypothetical protein O4G46_004571 [Vibrio alginolyticus]|uniref:Uncharacterized protein n=1 Tax=Vibrio mytili TaxID=50718 RepID=A0A0C3DD29_9VIBR|nr:MULTISPECIES: hypothetical protein [Vibrio harveyi group]EGR2699510.1 hypothetical protein [Vibrio parahaemolyticus]KIN09264.1 hypothetical protein SU60_20355 [Vibrio mytili]MBE4308541.1 hypothetical protein [Vibrio parahaemolyticus]MBS9925337.1 hypothetical protein [Vibrio alginolyticus]MCQ9070216.1 hypothetical protein [Vibrio alginolyticus]
MSQVLVYSKRDREMSYLSVREERETKLNNFKVVYNDISDEEALRRANSINSDEKNSVPKVRLKRQYIKEKKECRVPGLYGCNRYKSRRNETFNVF